MSKQSRFLRVTIVLLFSSQKSVSAPLVMAERFEARAGAAFPTTEVLTGEISRNRASARGGARAIMAPSTSVLPAARYLFYALEDASAQGLSKDALEKLLGESGDFLCGCLGSYSPPSAASKSAVESGTVRYGGTSLKLTESIREVTIAASAKLALNEVQTYAMLRRCVDEDKLAMPTECDDDLVERLTTFYFRERLSLLKCVHQLFVRAIDAQEDHLSAPVRASLERLLRDGLAENLVASLCAHARGSTWGRVVRSGGCQPVSAWRGSCPESPEVLKNWGE